MFSLYDRKQGNFNQYLLKKNKMLDPQKFMSFNFYGNFIYVSQKLEIILMAMNKKMDKKNYSILIKMTYTQL